MKQPREDFLAFARRIRAEGYPELAAKLRTDRPGRVVGRTSEGEEMKSKTRRHSMKGKK